MFIIPIEKDNPTKSWPLCVSTLIAINILIFIASYLIFDHDNFVKEYGFIPSSYTYSTIFFSMFLHGGIWHILGNMLFLYMYGDNVEEALGPFLFLFSYILCGLGGTALYYFFNMDSTIPCIGASGAISGVVGLYMLLFPNAHVDINFYIGRWSIGELHTNALGAILAWFGMQTLLGIAIYYFSELQIIKIAFWAHVGGLSTGFLLGFLFKMMGIKTQIPNEAYNIIRKEEGKFWCPYCGKKHNYLKFGSYTCTDCGAKFKFTKEEIEQ